MKKIGMLTLLFLSAIVSGCVGPTEPTSVEDFQSYYTSTRWYFSKYQAHLTDLASSKIQDNRGMQAFLTSPSGTHIIYGELEPSDFMKSFWGKGTLIQIPSVSEPIFEMDSDYTQRNPTRILMIAFVGGGAIRSKQRTPKTNRAGFSRSLDIAKQSYQQLLSRQSKDGETSNQQRLEATGETPAPQP